jgi:SAM-dependent methyltransferase
VDRLIASELMDDETFGTPSLVRGALEGLVFVNRYLGGWSALRAEVDAMQPLPRIILDVGAGAADLSRWLLDYLRRRGIQASAVALDRSRRVLDAAQTAAAPRDDLRFVQGDAEHIPFADRSFDLAMMNLALHHFDENAVPVLRELARVARHVIINDLRRSRFAWTLARFAFPLLTPNVLLRNDGPISVRRAYTPGELTQLAEAAGWARIVVRKRPCYRMTLAGGA